MNHDGPRGYTVSPRVALLSILCFWLVYFAVATVRSLMLDFGHQTEMLAARAFVTAGSMVATYIVYLAMRPLAGKSLAANVTAVALLAAPAAVAYSSMNWMAFQQVDRKIEAEKRRAIESRNVMIGERGIAEAREHALDAIAAAHDAIREAAKQAKAAAAWFEPADGLRIEAGFGTSDGVEQLGADAVAFAGLLPAGVCGERRDQADRDEPPRPGTPAHRLGQQDLLTRWHGRWPRSAQRISRSS